MLFFTSELRLLHSLVKKLNTIRQFFMNFCISYALRLLLMMLILTFDQVCAKVNQFAIES